MPETARASRGKQAKARIRQAFTKLLREKPIQRIAVKELCQEAGVNRSTFYAHYQDIYDLLRWLLEHETVEALGGAEDWQAALLDAFRYIRDNHMVIYHIYRSAGRDNLLDCPFYSLARAIASASLEREARELRLPEADADFLTDFYMYAIAGVMIGWFAGDMREEPEELVGRLSRLLEGEFRRSAEKFAPEETAV